MGIDELEVYCQAMAIGERVWRIVAGWDYFAKDTIGKQWVRAVDSVAANLSEGYGRFFYKEKRQYGYYSRGSLYETRTWMRKAANRGLISKQDADAMEGEFTTIGKKLNGYIKSIGSQPGAVHEERAEYEVSGLPKDVYPTTQQPN